MTSQGARPSSDSTDPLDRDSTESRRDKSRGQSIEAVQASGLPFQLAVESRIRDLGRSHSTRVLAREVPWELPEAGRLGWADIVVDCNTSIYCVVECKRYSPNGSLVFLRTQDAPAAPDLPILHFRRAAPTEHDRGHPGSSGYVYVGHNESERLVSSFCVFKDSEQRILEKIAGEVCLATEALMSVELQGDDDGAYPPLPLSGTRCYAAVIVVNVPLFLCTMSPYDVSLETGRLDDPTKAPVEEVPYIRFQKPLLGLSHLGLLGRRRSWVSSQPVHDRRTHLSGYVAKKERCVWIVSARHLEIFFGAMLNVGFAID
jgi:hypothetical protein